MVVGAVLWFFLSCVVASGARARGRDVTGWFLLSILATPILAALFLLLFPPVAIPGSAEQDRMLYASLERSWASQDNNWSRSVLTTGTIIFVFAIAGVAIFGAYLTSEFAPAARYSPSITASQNTASLTYEAVAALPCSTLLDASETARFSDLSEPIVEYVSRRGADLGSAINVSSYALTACRLNENQTIGGAVSDLFGQKRLNRLPRIPIGGATGDPADDAIWVAFRKWIRHRGPRPDFGAMPSLQVIAAPVFATKESGPSRKPKNTEESLIKLGFRDCLISNAKDGPYTSLDGGKSALIMISVACKSQWEAWLAECVAEGGTEFGESGCRGQSMILSQMTLKLVGK